MSDEKVQEPFFARFLEGQTRVRTGVKAGGGFTMKYPSDNDELQTAKYPSDNDGHVTTKYPSDGDDSVAI